MAKRISSEELLKDSGTPGKVVPTYIERVGFWLAVGVGSIMAVVTVLDVVFFWFHYPDMPVATGDVLITKEALEQYKELSAVATESALNIFKTVVQQTLLPVLMTVIGYIFGKESRKT